MTTTGPKKASTADIEYFRERQKNRVYEAVYLKYAEEFQKNGLTKADIARFLDKKPEQITRWLSGPGNWTLDTISDLLLAFDSEMEFSVSGKISERRNSNYVHPVTEYATSNKVEVKQVMGDGGAVTSAPDFNLAIATTTSGTSGQTYSIFPFKSPKK